MTEYLTAEERAWRAYPDAEDGTARRRQQVWLAALLRDHEAGLYALALADGPGEPPVGAAELLDLRRKVAASPKWFTLTGPLLNLLDHRTAQLAHARATIAWLTRDQGIDPAALDRAELRGWRKARAACVEAARRAYDRWEDGPIDVLEAVEVVPEEMP